MQILAEDSDDSYSTGEDIAAGSVEIGASVGSMEPHYCSECGKGFSTGKALGGHVSSAHVQPGNGQPDEVELGAEFVCNLCPRRFSKVKALYGHMRNHPERKYRGMNSPPGIQITAVDGETSGGDSGVEEMEVEHTAPGTGGPIRRRRVAYSTAGAGGLLQGWSSRGRRGRPEIPKPVPDWARIYGPVVVRAARTLMAVACSHGNQQKPKDTESDDQFNNPNVNEKTAEKRKALVIRHENAPTEPLNSAPDESANNWTHTHPTNCQPLMEVAMAVEEKAKSEEIVVANNQHNVGLGLGLGFPPLYVCHICNKGFSSHQALGGHVSSHTKFKFVIENSIDNFGGGPHDESGSRAGKGDNGGGDGEVYVCEVCGRSFGSRRALGGHRKFHGRYKDGGSSSRDGEDGGKGGVGFDLNRMPEDGSGFAM